LTELADAYGDSGDIAKMQEMERDAVTAYEDLLGKDHLDTLTACAKLAGTLLEHGDAGDAERGVTSSNPSPRL
jgi:hypothetical protein